MTYGKHNDRTRARIAGELWAKGFDGYDSRRARGVYSFKGYGKRIKDLTHRAERRTFRQVIKEEMS